MNKKRVLLISPQGAAGTGSGTYSSILSSALQQVGSLEVSSFSSERDLASPCDVVHVVDIKHLPLRVAQAVQAPLVVELHDVYWVSGEELFPTPDLPLRLYFGAMRRRRYAPVLGRAAVIIAHSKYAASRIPYSNVRVIPYAVEPLEIGLPLAKRSPRVVFAGRDYFRKGLPVLMKAWRRVSSLRPDATLVIAGREFAHGRLYARLVSLRSSVQWLGNLPRNALLEEIRAARALVLPSWAEAFGVVTIEAAALGTPVVATRVGGVPEALDGGSTGILVDRGDSVALAKAILGCLEPEPADELVEMTARARETASRYSVENLVNAVLRVYRDVGG